MRKPSLSLETFAAALAVLGATSGCAKEERALPESPPPAAAPQAQTLPASGATPAEQPATTTAPSLPVDGRPPGAAAAAPQAGAPSVAAKPAEGAKKKDVMRTGAASSGKPVNAACGAGTCTDDMKKGNGN